jgi:hypothetical protein
MSVKLEKPLDGFDYWDSHPSRPLHVWQAAVGSGGTRLGYWSWVRDTKPTDCRCGDRIKLCNSCFVKACKDHHGVR